MYQAVAPLLVVEDSGFKSSPQSIKIADIVGACVWQEKRLEKHVGCLLCTITIENPLVVLHREEDRLSIKNRLLFAGTLLQDRLAPLVQP